MSNSAENTILFFAENICCTYSIISGVGPYWHPGSKTSACYPVYPQAFTPVLTYTMFSCCDAFFALEVVALVLTTILILTLSSCSFSPIGFSNRSPWSCHPKYIPALIVLTIELLTTVRLFVLTWNPLSWNCLERFVWSLCDPVQTPNRRRSGSPRTYWCRQQQQRRNTAPNRPSCSGSSSELRWDRPA